MTQRPFDPVRTRRWRPVRGATLGRMLALCLGTPLALLFADPLPSQQRPQTLPGFSEVIDVRVVNLEVVVTDRNGNRVSGLSAKDFRLRVDGEEVPIDYFSEISEGVVQAAAQGGELPAVPALGAGGKMRTNFLVFIDDFFAIGRDRDRVLDRLEEDLAELGAGDRVAMVAYNGKRLELLTSWTQDRGALRQVFARARARPAYGTQRLAELRTNDDQRRSRSDLMLERDRFIERAGGELPERAFLEGRLDGVELDYANRLTEQVERSVLASVSALRSFAAPSGRKVLLLLSGGWPFSPAEYTVNDYRASELETVAGALDTTVSGRNQLLRPLADTANLLGYTLYPVDVPGQNRQVGVDASVAFTENDASLGPAAGAGGTARPRELTVHDSLHYLAEATGGRALINALRDRSLAEAVADTRSFYWLGFTPQRHEDDGHHDIEIEVIGRPDLRVRSRRGYVDLSRGTEVTMMVESALLFGDPPTTKPLRLEFGRPRRSGLGKMKVPLEVGIPMDEITLVETGGRFLNELEIRITVMDKIGNRSETTVETIAIEGDRPPRPGQLYFYETDLVLRRKEHRIVVAVYDPIGGAILSSSSEISAL